METTDITVEGTPNPNAAKFVVGTTLAEEGSRSYFDAGDAEDDPLARRLFGIDGVEALLIVDDFVTVTKEEEMEWADLVGRVKAVLVEELEGDA